MKKTMSAVLVAGMLTMFCGTGAALEPTTLELDCDYYYGGEGFLGTHSIMVGLFGTLGIEGWPESAAVADIESVLAAMDGDGILDMDQLGLLAAVLCDADAKDANAVMAQYLANGVEYDAMVAGLAALFGAIGEADGDALAAHMIATGTILVDWATLMGAGYEAILELGTLLVGAGTELGGFVTEYGSLVLGATPVLVLVKPAVVGLAGLSTEMQATIDALLIDLLEELDGVDLQLMAASAGLIDVWTMLGMGMSGDPALDAVANAAKALADEIDAAIPLLAIAPPAFVIYGVAKTAGEPFSAFGDFDGDGVTNGETYDIVMGNGGDVAGFVAAASGADPFYEGNPGLPATGLAGLALLSGLAALGGALAMRKQ